MADISYMDGVEMAASIVSYGAEVSGMTAAEAATALNASSYNTNGLTQIVSFPMEYVSGGKVSVEAMYASQLWEYWKLNAEVAGTTVLGAAAAGAVKWASGVLIGDPALAGTLAGTGGLLTMTLPVAASLAAPILGVSIGNALYQSNPEWWTKVSQALLPWAYEDRDTVAAVVDENGQVYLPKDMIDALGNLFEEEGIGSGSSGASSQLDTGNAAQPIPFTTGDLVTSSSPSYDHTYSGSAAKVCAGSNIYFFSDVPNTIVPYVINVPGQQQPITGSFTLSGSIVVNGRTIYLSTMNYSGTASIPLATSDANFNESANVGYTVLFGNIIPGGYPEGTSKWTGDAIDMTQKTPINVVNDMSTGSTTPYFPVTLPIGDPTVTNDPAVRPDPTSPVQLPELDPYIPPETSPDQWPEELPEPSHNADIAPQSNSDPSYIPEPDLNPDLNPSAEPDAESAPEDSETPPQSSGETPSIVFPPVGPWPTIIPSTGSGLVHVYNPTPAQFIAFGNWLWVTYADPSIPKLWNNPFDGVIGALELYATPSVDGTDTIKSGFLDSGVSAGLVRVRYSTINCGSILIPEYYGNYFDYSPYSRAYIYLPFIGIVEVDVDDIVGHAVNVCYHVDAYNGSCIAQITVAKDDYQNTVYQFSGNCGVDLPMAGGSQAAIRGAMISAAAYGIGSTINGIINGSSFGALGGGMGAGKGGLVGGITGAISGVASGIANLASQKSSVQHSGSFGASYGAMGIKKPYIIIRRPVQKFVNNYQKDYGFPAHKRVVIGACIGFLRVKEIDVKSTLATDEEKVLIEQYLKSGVYVTE